MATADELKPKKNFGDAATASTDALVQQIPTAGSQTAPVVGESASGSELGRNVQNTLSALPGAAGVVPAVGRIAGLAGGLGKAAAGTSAVQAVAPYVPPVAAIGGLGVASVPAQPKSVLTLSPTDNARARPSVAPSSQPVATTTAPSAPAPLAPPAAPAQQPLGIAGVVKTVGADGRTLYSDGNAASDASLMARGSISAQNLAAADALSARGDAETQARLGAAAFQQQARDARAANAAGQANARGFEQRKVADDLLKVATGTRSRSRAAGAMGLVSNLNQQQTAERTEGARLGLSRDQLAQTTSNQNATTGIAQQRLGLDATTAGLDARGRVQLLGAQDALAKATTPEERAAAEDTLRALQGKYERPTQNRFTVVPGGADELGNKQASTVLNNQTGEFVTPGQTKLPAGMTRQVGTAGGKPVYEDANGKRFTAGN